MVNTKYIQSDGRVNNYDGTNVFNVDTEYPNYAGATSTTRILIQSLSGVGDKSTLESFDRITTARGCSYADSNDQSLIS